MINYCSKCGEKLLGNESFCANCGTSIEHFSDKSVGSDGLTSTSRKSLNYLRVVLTSFLMGCIPMVFLPMMFNFLEGKKNLMDIELKEENIILGIIAIVISFPAFLWVSKIEEKKRKRKEQMEFEQIQREKEALETNRRILELMEKKD